jgi:hypothetical protein
MAPKTPEISKINIAMYVFIILKIFLTACPCIELLEHNKV